jgi:trk system potassium uptake protein TrkA
MSKSEKLYIVIVGCGRLGSHLANRLSRTGHSVVVIDKDGGAFDQLTAEFGGFHIEGNATEFAVLKQAKIDKADVVIAATHDDNLNMMVAQIAKKLFDIGKVMARVLDPTREEIYRELGIETVCPTVIAAELVVDAFVNKDDKSGQGS